MYKVQLFNKISPKGLEMLGSNFEYGDDIENPDAILLRSASLHDYEFGENLLCIGRAGAGVNNIPLDKCGENGIAVFNSPGANANAVKELVLTALFMCSRDIAGGLKWVSENAQDSEISKSAEKAKKAFAGCEIKGKTLGIIGLGAIGSLVADAAIALGMDVLGYDPYLSLTSALRLNPNIKVVNKLDDIFEKSDYITLHLPVTESTKDMISADQLIKCKDGVCIINMARAGLVNESDLIESLNSGKVAKYSTDFASKQLANAKNTVVFPHLGASTKEAEDNCAVMAAKEIKDYIENGNILNSVNFPNLDMGPACAGKRLCAVHEADQKTAANIHQVLVLSGNKSRTFVSKQKGNFAYTIIDTENPISTETLKDIEGFESVFRARVI